MIYSLQNVADEMKMSLKTVRRFVASQELKTTKVNNTYTVTEEDFNEFKKYIPSFRSLLMHEKSVPDKRSRKASKGGKKNKLNK